MPCGGSCGLAYRIALCLAFLPALNGGYPYRRFSMAEMRRLTADELASFAYSLAELRLLAREHGVPVPRGALHHEVFRALTAAGIRLSAKGRSAA